MNWVHLFPNDKQHMDYIASRLWDGTADWYMSLHSADSLELCTVDMFMWSLRSHYEDLNTSEQVRAYLHTFRQRKKTVCEYTEEFKWQAVKIQGWPDGVLAEQYWLGLHLDIRETILRTVQPVSLLAWMREAADAESCLRTTWIDNAVTLGKGPSGTLKPKTPSRPMERVRDQHMKQSLCLKCGEPGHFVATCLGLGAVKKSPEKVHTNTPARKPTAHPKTQHALQISYPEEDPELSPNKGTEVEKQKQCMGKGSPSCKFFPLLHLYQAANTKVAN
ncbi:UNVERIFIED_CONTAM: hypothetical protein K2H54_003762 [Gekko kuhli]